MNDNSKKEVCQALYDAGMTYSMSANQTMGVLTKEWDLPRCVTQCESLVKKLVSTTEVSFSAKIDKRFKRKYVQKTKLGEAVLMGLRMDIDAIKHHYPLHQFNPYLDLFVRHAEERNLFDLQRMVNHVTDDEVVRCVDVLTGFVDDVRKEAHSTKFKKRLNDFKRSANKNYRELLLYIKALFERYSRLLVLRIDFGYRKVQSWPNETEVSVSYQEVRKHREELFKYLAKDLPFDCLAGYAWKLEYGLDKSYHIHAMIFLDGSKVREDVTIARMIGEHWGAADGVTGGKGLYFNCNAFKENYKSCGIGMINYHDDESHEGLRKAAVYMTKPDYYIRMVAPGNGRTFGKGIMPEPKTSMRGRPRAKDNLAGDEA